MRNERDAWDCEITSSSSEQNKKRESKNVRSEETKWKRVEFMLWISFCQNDSLLKKVTRICLVFCYIFCFVFCSTHVLKLPMMKLCRRFIYHVTHQMKPHCHTTVKKKIKIKNDEEKNKFINEMRKYWNVRTGNHKNDSQYPCAWNAAQRGQCIIILGFHHGCWCYYTTLHENPITKITMNFHFQFLHLI